MRSTTYTTGVLCVVATLLLGTGIAQAADFDGFGSYISGYKTSVPVSATAKTSASRAAFALDGHTMYYLMDNQESSDPGVRGLYAVKFAADFMSGTNVGRIALSDYDYPSDVAVGADGSAYVCYDYTAAVRKVTNPMGSPTETTLFSGNGFLGGAGSGDDDPIAIGIAPAGFNGSKAHAGDIILSDNGLNGNSLQAVESVAPDGSSCTIMTQWTTLANGADNLDLMAVDAVHNRVYLAPIDMTRTAGTSIFSLDADGNMTEHVLTVPGGRDLSNCQAIAVNPLDGSIWIGDDDTYPSDTYEPDDAIYRIDPITFEMTIQIDFAAEEGNTSAGRGYPNLNYSMTFTPDGRHLIIGDIDADSFGSPNSMMVFGVVPEPATMLLLGIGGCLLGARRRRS